MNKFKKKNKPTNQKTHHALEQINQLFGVLKKANSFCFYFFKIHILLPLFKRHAISLVCMHLKLLRTAMLYQTSSANKHLISFHI